MTMEAIRRRSKQNTNQQVIIIDKKQYLRINSDTQCEGWILNGWMKCIFSFYLAQSWRHNIAGLNVDECVNVNPQWHKCTNEGFAQTSDYLFSGRYIQGGQDLEDIEKLGFKYNIIMLPNCCSWHHFRIYAGPGRQDQRHEMSRTMSVESELFRGGEASQRF